MTFRKSINRHHDLESLCFLLGELQAALMTAGFEAEAMQVKAIHFSSVEPERMRMIEQVLPRHFPGVFPEAVLEKVPNNCLYKGEPT